MTDTKKVKARMVELGYTQSEVAKLIGVSTPMFNRKLNNKSFFAAPQIQSMLHLLHVDEKEIIPYFFAN